MAHETSSSNGSSARTGGGSFDLLNGCLVDGDSEQQRRERKVRRRALAISITAQGAVLAVILLVPLFGRPAPISRETMTPIPPYSRPQQRHVVVTQVVHQRVRPTGLFAPTRIPQRINEDPQPPEPVPNAVPFAGTGIEVPGAIPMAGSRSNSQPPPPVQAQPKAPKVVHLSQIDASKLVYRIEPVYPVLMKQIGKSGKVELHAIIGEDGMIQSLEAVGGDPMFFSSAMQAVKQWRYTPTLLNGQAVKVDTYITVIYNMTR
jgi:TonB family protein